MTTVPVGRAGPQEVEAARLLLARLGVSPAELLDPAAPRRAVPTFAAYVSVVAAGMGEGTRRVYGSYWNRIVAQWGDRRLDEPTPRAAAHGRAADLLDGLPAPGRQRRGAAG